MTKINIDASDLAPLWLYEVTFPRQLMITVTTAQWSWQRRNWRLWGGLAETFPAWGWTLHRRITLPGQWKVRPRLGPL